MRRELWAPHLGYPGYSISTFGRVRNDRRGRVLTPLEYPGQRQTVKMTYNGVQVNRNVAKLVCETYHLQRDGWTTPIHFDGNMQNCHVENLDWRPRWFALKHTQQFGKDHYEYPDPVRNVDTGTIYDNPWSVVFACGILYMDLILSISNKTYVFPTMNVYEWA